MLFHHKFVFSDMLLINYCNYVSIYISICLGFFHMLLQMHVVFFRPSIQGVLKAFQCSCLGTDRLWRNFLASNKKVKVSMGKSPFMMRISYGMGNALLKCTNVTFSATIWGFPKMVGFPNNHRFSLLKMIILGCEMGVPPFKETPI